MTFNGLRTALQRRFTAAGLTFCGVHGFRRGWFRAAQGHFAIP
jgi:hypothetical protein